MGIAVMYRCDRCGAVSEDYSALELQAVGFGIRHAKVEDPYRYSPIQYTFYDGQTRQAMWCGKCCKEVGIVRSTDESGSAIRRPKPPSLEDMIREIIKQTEAIKAELSKRNDNT